MSLFLPTHRDLIRVAIFSVLGALVLPLFPAIAFTGGFFAAIGVGLVFAAAYLLGGSAYCYFSRFYAPKLKLERPLPAFAAMTVLSLIALTIFCPLVGLVVSGWLAAVLASVGLTVVAALSTINEPRD